VPFKKAIAAPANIDSGRPDTEDLRVIHKMLRRELSLLGPLIAGVAGGDTGRAAMLADHVGNQLLFLDSHHHGEDEYLWPLLERRAGPELDADPTLLDRMNDQHRTISASVDRIRALLPGWSATASVRHRDELADELAVLRPLLLAHLEEEETHILPLAGRHLTIGEWGQLAAHGRAATPKRPDLALRRLGEVLEDADPGERARFLLTIPPPARLIWKYVGEPSYRRRLARLRGGISPPATGQSHDRAETNDRAGRRKDNH
jgi:hemerythrin-like domain-containing protein